MVPLEYLRENPSHCFSASRGCPHSLTSALTLGLHITRTSVSIITSPPLGLRFYCCIFPLLKKKKKLKVSVTQWCPTLCGPLDCPWNSPGKNTEVGSHYFSKGSSWPGIDLNDLLHCRQIIYHLSHHYKGRPTIKTLAITLGLPVNLGNLSIFRSLT